MYTSECHVRILCAGGWVCMCTGSLPPTLEPVPRYMFLYVYMEQSSCIYPFSHLHHWVWVLRMCMSVVSTVIIYSWYM
jgi:hypothetical protein